jgi:hypothetical protein
MVIEDIEDAVEQYHKKLITAKGLVWHYLKSNNLQPHEVNPLIAEIELGITSRCIYYKLKELQSEFRSEMS